MRVTRHPAGARSGRPELRASSCAPSGHRLRVNVKRVLSAMTQRSDLGGGGPSPLSNLWVPSSPICGVRVQQVLTHYLLGAQDARMSTHSLWDTCGETKATRGRASAWVFRSGDSSRQEEDTFWPHVPSPAPRIWGAPQTPAQPHPAPSPDSSAKPSGPRAMVAGQYIHVAPARVAGPLGPTRPQASSLAGRRVEGSGSRQPEVCARAYISHQLFLPRAARKPGGPGLPLPRLVKPAQQHPRPGGALVPGCHQRLPPAAGAQRCPNSLPSGC